LSSLPSIPKDINWFPRNPAPVRYIPKRAIDTCHTPLHKKTEGTHIINQQDSISSVEFQENFPAPATRRNWMLGGRVTLNGRSCRPSATLPSGTRQATMEKFSSGSGRSASHFRRAPRTELAPKLTVGNPRISSIMTNNLTIPCRCWFFTGKNLPDSLWDSGFLVVASSVTETLAEPRGESALGRAFYAHVFEVALVANQPIQLSILPIVLENGR
jgi:hypothetical protein